MDQTPVMDVVMSEPCAELFKALAAFQGEVVTPQKDAVNPHFGKKYVDLAAVIEAVRLPMAKHGLSLIQVPLMSANGTHVRLVTIVAHSSGQSLKGVLDMPVVQRTPQAVGSAITYARRYCAMAMLRVAAAEEDDDGEAASRGGQREQPQSKPQQRQQAKREQAPAERKPAPKQAASKGAVDEYGLTVPDVPCPVVSDTAKEHPGKKWSEVPEWMVCRWLEQRHAQMSESQLEWAQYIAARRQARKAREERAQAEAEQGAMEDPSSEGGGWVAGDEPENVQGGADV
jgi:hypothetical protein